MQNPSSSLYDDGDSPSDARPDSGNEEKGGEQTALLPKTLFGKDLKPGDKCDIEVVRVHEDAYEVQGCEGHDDEEQSDQPPPEEQEPEQAPNPMME